MLVLGVVFNYFIFFKKEKLFNYRLKYLFNLTISGIIILEFY